MSDAIAIALPERMDIASAESTHVQLEQALEQGCAVVLEGASVQKLDTAGVQILISFFDTAQSQHLSVNWQTPSETIKNTFSFLNLDEAVGLAAQAGVME